MIPIGDFPNPKGVPYVTYFLIAANCLIYALVSLPLSMQGPDPNDPMLREYLRVVLENVSRPVSIDQILHQMSAYDLFVFEHGFRPAAPNLLDLFTSMFLHGGLMHLLGNMLFLWIYGDNVEDRLGRLGFLIAYLGTGVAATASNALLDLDSPLPLIGASGAISGVLGFYFIFFPRNTVKVLFLFFPFFVNIVQVPARIVLGIYLLISNLLPLLASSGAEGGGVAHGAHIGGFIAGLVVALVMDRREVSERPREYRRGKPDLTLVRSPRETVAAAIVGGDYEGAAELYFSLPSGATRGVLRPEHSLALADWLAREGQARAALAVYRRHLRDYPQGPGVAEAHVGAGYVQLRYLGETTMAYQHFLAALDLDPSAETAAGARAGIEEIEGLQKFPGRRRR